MLKSITIVGPGRLGTALASSLFEAGYRIAEIISRDSPASRRRAQLLARAVKAAAVTPKAARLDAHLVWLCVPDNQIAVTARELARRDVWKGKIVFHSSGALSSAELKSLRTRGAAVAAVHPLMTFVHGSMPSLRGVTFSAEGDAVAVRIARPVVRRLGGQTSTLHPKKKTAYHAWGAFTSPLLLVTLLASEQVARVAGLSSTEARRRMMPIVRQTLANYSALGPARSLSGPLVRGDAEVIARHLKELKKLPEIRALYIALARTALRYLPSKNRKNLEAALRG